MEAGQGERYPNKSYDLTQRCRNAVHTGGGGGLTCYDKLLYTQVQNMYKPKKINMRSCPGK